MPTQLNSPKLLIYGAVALGAAIYSSAVQASNLPLDSDVTVQKSPLSAVNPTAKPSVPSSAKGLDESNLAAIPRGEAASEETQYLAQGFQLEFESPSRFEPILGPVPELDPEVYSPDMVESVPYGWLFGGDFGIERAEGVFGGLRFGYRDTNGRSIIFTGLGGEYLAAGDLTYTRAAYNGDETGEGRRIGYQFSANFTNSRDNAYLSDEDDDDIDEVFLPVGDEHEPWVNRLGFQGRVMVPISSTTVLMPGLSYEKIRIQNSAFTDNLYGEDEEGNPFGVSDDGKDDLVLLSLFAVRDNAVRDEYGFPLSGNVFQFGTEQSLPVGTDTFDFNRLSGAYVQYFPLNLFGFDEGPRTLILGLQGGTILGDVPGYEAFDLGGFNSARGYSQGDVGTASSFVQARLEYRFPILSWEGGFFEQMRGALGVQYVSDLGTGDEVIGEPAEVRNKPGDGFGFSVGLHFLDFDLPVVDTLRVTAGVNDRGDFSAYFSLGPAF